MDTTFFDLIKQWKKEVNIKEPLLIKERSNTLTIACRRPGIMIGKHGCLVDKYLTMIKNRKTEEGYYISHCPIIDKITFEEFDNII